MRLPHLFTIVLGIVAFCGYAFKYDEIGSNLTYLRSPRHILEAVQPMMEIEEQYIHAQTDENLNSSLVSATDVQCSTDKPCLDGSCCNALGQCGYRPEHCKSSCVSNCGATAPCGEHSENGAKMCPLTVCCSFFGMCGTSNIFCRDQTDDGQSTPCQRKFGKCGDVTPPICGNNSGTASRRVGYYEAWNSRRAPCDKKLPQDLDTAGFTHLVLAFATINPHTFKISEMHPKEEDIYYDFITRLDGIPKYLGIGGWEFSNPGATRRTWSQMASTQENRHAFIESVGLFLSKWQFRGLDIHWQWPGATSRGGDAATDKQNLIALMVELRQSLDKNFGISIALPAQYDYLKYMEVKAIESQVDWFNMLTYDLHGPWDANVPTFGNKIKPHTDLKEIDKALQLLWFNDINPGKVNLGIANYGRGYTVADRSCMHFDCPFAGPSKAGECTMMDGILSRCEIHRRIGANSLSPSLIAEAGVKHITWDDQWIGYDDEETLQLKIQLANNRCLGGTALWALSYGACDENPSEPAVSASASAPGAPWTSIKPSSSLTVLQSPPFAPTVSASQSLEPPATHKSTQTNSALPSAASSQTSITPISGIPPPLNGPSTMPTSKSTPTFWPSGTPVSATSFPITLPDDSSALPFSETSSLVSSAVLSAITISQTVLIPTKSNILSSMFASNSVFPPSHSAEPSASLSFGSSLASESSATSSAQNATVRPGNSSATTESSAFRSSAPLPTLVDPISVSKPMISDETGSTAQRSSSNVPSFATLSPSLGIQLPSSLRSSIATSNLLTRSVFGPQPAPSLSGSFPIPVLLWPVSPSATSTADPSPTSPLFPQPPLFTATDGLPHVSPSFWPQSPSSAGVDTSLQMAPSWSQSFPVTPTTDKTPISPISISTLPPTGTLGTRPSLLISSSVTSTGDFLTSSILTPTLPSAVTTGPQTSSFPVPDPWSSSGSMPVPTKEPNKCVSQDCVKECLEQRLISFIAVKRPICVCQKKTCDEDSDIDDDSDNEDESDNDEDSNFDNGHCSLLGCGCGWMGLHFGPGCGNSSLDLDMQVLGLGCGIFGCNGACHLFGGCSPPRPPPLGPSPSLGLLPPSDCGPLGCGGYCNVKGGCKPCPPQICGGPLCTKLGGCGPTPGPIPTSLSLIDRPDSEKCEEAQKTTVTERFVVCTEGVEIKPTTIASVNFTISETITSTCVPLYEATLKACGILDWASTTTASSFTSSKEPSCTRAPLSLDDDEGDNEQVSQSAPACTRAPLSLDDDEGDNEPYRPSSLSSTVLRTPLSTPLSVVSDLSTYSSGSSSFSRSIMPTTLSTSSQTWEAPPSTLSEGSVVTMQPPTIIVPSKTASSSFQTWAVPPSTLSEGPIKTNLQPPTIIVPSKSATPPLTSTSFQPVTSVTSTPECTPGSVSPGSRWQAVIKQGFQDMDSHLTWNLYDQNGCHAGSGMVKGFNTESLYADMYSVERPPQHSMPYAMRANVQHATYRYGNKVTFTYMREVAKCKSSCLPSFEIRNELSLDAWRITNDCQNECGRAIITQNDVGCSPKANILEKILTGKDKFEYKREFWCWWRMPYDSSPFVPPPLIAPDATWRIKIHQEMEFEHSIVDWILIDPNGFEAGKGRLEGNQEGVMLEGAITSSNRPESDSLRFKIRITVTDPSSEIDTSIRFQILKSPEKCKRICEPSFWTMTNYGVGFWGNLAWMDTCKNDCGYDVIDKDTTNCDSLGGAFHPKNAGRERDFNCWFKAY